MVFDIRYDTRYAKLVYAVESNPSIFDGRVSVFGNFTAVFGRPDGFELRAYTMYADRKHGTVERPYLRYFVYLEYQEARSEKFIASYVISSVFLYGPL